MATTIQLLSNSLKTTLGEILNKFCNSLLPMSKGSTIISKALYKHLFVGAFWIRQQIVRLCKILLYFKFYQPTVHNGRQKISYIKWHNDYSPARKKLRETKADNDVVVVVSMKHDLWSWEKNCFLQQQTRLYGKTNYF